jgi:1,4-dihydroxy-2-naphthoyl-CoA hydrolase
MLMVKKASAMVQLVTHRAKTTDVPHRCCRFRQISDSVPVHIAVRSSAVLAANWCSGMTSTPPLSGMPGHFSIRVTNANKDKLVGELDVDDCHLNNSGHVHDGALAAFADDLGGRLAGLNVPPGFRTTTIESKTNIFRACVPGRLTGVAVPVHVGRRMVVLQISIHRSDGKLAGMMAQTQMILPSGSRHLRIGAAARSSFFLGIPRPNPFPQQS